MIQSILPEQYGMLNRLLSQNSARSYFIRLALLQPDAYQRVLADFDDAGTLRGLLCLRKSGTLQFFSDGLTDYQGFGDRMRELPWKVLISPESCCAPLISEGFCKTAAPIAWIARQTRLIQIRACEKAEPLTYGDLPEVSALYDRVFDHHMSLEQMKEKLASGRGRGVVIRRAGRIVSVGQTEFEEPDSALIVGVATAPEFRQQGLAEACLCSLSDSLLASGKTLWLQYDNPAAGKLYEKLGYELADRVMACQRKE